MIVEIAWLIASCISSDTSYFGSRFCDLSLQLVVPYAMFADLSYFRANGVFPARLAFSQVNTDSDRQLLVQLAKPGFDLARSLLRDIRSDRSRSDVTS